MKVLKIDFDLVSPEIVKRDCENLGFPDWYTQPPAVNRDVVEMIMVQLEIDSKVIPVDALMKGIIVELEHGMAL